MTESVETGRRLGRAFTALLGALIVVGAWVVLQLWGLEKTPFHTKGEPREGLVVAEMLRGGDWVLPRRNGVEFPSKPPFFHWLGALVSLTGGGVSESAIRLPSAVLSGVALLAVFAAGSILWNPGAGTIAALALMTSFEWERAATSARVDMTLTCGLTLALTGLTVFRSRGRWTWLALAYVGMAVAVLGKGPVGIALPLVQIAVITVFDCRLAFLRRLYLPLGMIVVVLLAGPWYALALREGGYAFFAKQILFENVYRLVGGSGYGGGHAHSVGYLAGQLLLGTLPWSLLVPGVAAALWRDRRSFRRDDPRFFLTVWILLVFGFYSVAASKRGVYLLGLYPALFLLLGWWWDQAVRGAVQPRWLSRALPVAFSAWIAAGLLALTALAAAAEAGGMPIFGVVAGALTGEPAAQVRQFALFVGRQGATLPAVFAGAAAGAIVCALAVRSERWGAVFLGLFLATAAVVLAVQQSILPEIARQKTRRGFAESVRRIVPEGATPSSYRDFDYGLVFYWGRRLPVWPEPGVTAPPWLVVAEQDWDGFGSAERTVYERLPMIESGRAGNMGRMLLAQRLADPASVPNLRWAPPAVHSGGEDEDAD